MHMIKKGIRDNAFECARVSSRVYGVGVELTGTPWIISNKVEVAAQGENVFH
jgi:hypothetical protein